MFLNAEHARRWKMILKYTVNRALYHILLQIVELKCIYSNSKHSFVLLFTCPHYNNQQQHSSFT